MRRFLALALAAAAGWWFFARRRDAGRRLSVTIGYSDGSAVTLDPGSPELDRLLAIAAGASTR